MANKGSNHNSKQPIFCSFCGRLRQEVDKLIEGPNSVYICDECVEICHKIMKDEEILSQENIMGSKDLVSSDELPSPEVIKNVLDEYVIGQDDEKRFYLLLYTTIINV